MRLSSLRKLKPGDRVTITKEFKEFWKLQAWTMCTRPNGMQSENEAKDYFIRKAISMSLPYTATLIEYRESVGAGPGASIKLKVGDLEDTCLVGVEEIGLKR